MTEPYAAASGLVRVYPGAAGATGRPALVWVHGGGFAGGTLDMPEADAVARAFAAHGITTVSVDYRLVSTDGLTGGVRYPAPSDDVIAAFRWTREHAHELGIDRSRIALGGASAGANLSAGAVLRLPVDERPALVFLAYPTLLAVQPAPDAALRALLDADPTTDRFGPDAVRRMYEFFLGGPVDDAPLPAVPGTATAQDVADFPPTIIINGEADELRVSGEVFARTLADAGREITAYTEPGTHHGHLNRPDEPAFTPTIDFVARRILALGDAH